MTARDLERDDVSADAAGEETPQVVVDQHVCIGCGRCVQICPTDVFALDEHSHKAAVAYEGDCCVCLLCVSDCPVTCITVDLRIRRYFVSIYDRLNIDVHVPLVETVRPRGSNDEGPK